MKSIIIILSIVVIALFTGTWIFGGLEWFFHFMGDIWGFLEKIFNVFGWNKGIL